MKLTVALFYSDYCPTCEEVLPVWKEFVELHKGEGLFIRIKKDETTSKMFKRFGVSWVPTVVFFIGEKEVKRVEGRFTLSELERALRRTLAKMEVLYA